MVHPGRQQNYGRGNYRDRPRKDPPPPRKKISLDGKSIPFYKDQEKTKLNPELLSDIAAKEAESLAKAGLNSNQLRKYFNDVKHQERLLKSGTEWGVVLPLFKMLKSKASYGCTPKRPKIPRPFMEFLVECVDSVEDKKDFDGFVKFFEAVVGFCYGYGLKEGR